MERRKYLRVVAERSYSQVVRVTQFEIVILLQSICFSLNYRGKWYLVYIGDEDEVLLVLNKDLSPVSKGLNVDRMIHYFIAKGMSKTGALRDVKKKNRELHYKGEVTQITGRYDVLGEKYHSIQEAKLAFKMFVHSKENS